jgi:hypothetical protein
MALEPRDFEVVIPTGVEAPAAESYFTVKCGCPTSGFSDVGFDRSITSNFYFIRNAFTAIAFGPLPAGSIVNSVPARTAPFEA